MSGERRRIVDLSVVAVSALAFAGSWLGIARADRQAQPVAVTASTAVVAEVGSAGGSLIEAPAPTPSRRVVVVRRSRAS